jgi:hypothetical protein
VHNSMFRVQLGGRHGVGLKEQTAEGDIGRRSGVWNPRDGDQKEVVVTYPKTSLHRVLLPKARVNRSAKNISRNCSGCVAIQYYSTLKYDFRRCRKAKLQEVNEITWL